jgi:hypothetical protein
MYAKISAAKENAERAYWRYSGIINRLRMEYWRRRYNALTIGEAVQQAAGGRVWFIGKFKRI